MTTIVSRVMLFVCCLLGGIVLPILADTAHAPQSATNQVKPLSPAEQFDLDTGNEGSESRFFQEFMHMLLSLGLIILVLLGAAWTMKKVLSQRLQQANTGSNIKVIERRSLSPKSAVYLIEVEGHTLLVGESPSSLHPLAEIKPQPPSSSFSEIYEKRQ